MIRQLSVHDLARKLAAKEPVLLVDVREPWEHEAAALAHSVHIPLNQIPYRSHELHPAVGAQVVVYCHHGIRSLSGAVLLQSAGFPDVVSLAGGIDAWSLQIDPKMPRY